MALIGESTAPAGVRKKGAVQGGDWAQRLVAALSASHARALVVLFLLSCAVFAPGFASLQPMDRDEPRFAQASKQMLETGDFVDIRFQDEARHKKPVGIYWLQSAVVAGAEALGVDNARATIAYYRIPSFLGAVATVLVTYWAALAFVSPGGALLAGAFMAASILLGVEARLAKTDAVLTATTVVMFGSLARLYLWRDRIIPAGTIAAFWAAFALSILVKGPIGPMVVGLAGAALSVRARAVGWLKGLRPGWGLLLTALIVAPWFIAIAMKTGGAFFDESVGKDMLAKVGSGQEKHWAPPGFYLLAFFGTFWPAAVLTAIALPLAWRWRAEPWVAVCLAWMLPSWIIFEAVPTKLPHYVLPLYPALAIFTVKVMELGEVGPHRPAAVPAALLIPFIPLGLLIGLGIAGHQLDGVPPYAGMPGMLVAALVAVWAWLAFRRGAVIKTAVLAIAASLVLSASVWGLTQPLLRALKLSPRLAEAVTSIGCPSPQVVTVGYREPSLVFLVGTDLAMASDGQGAAAFLDGPGCRIALVEARAEQEFLASLDEMGKTPRLVTRVPGFNINGGRKLDVGVYVTGE